MKAAKSKTVFSCTSCGGAAPRWMGKCPTCGEWNTLVEEVVRERSEKRERARDRGTTDAKGAAKAVPLSEVTSDEARRLPTGIGELDRVLGGGLVAGGVVLLGGDPGIGKSTLLMQALAALAARGKVALYATGEESASQVALRGERIGGEGMRDVRIVATTELEDALAVLDTVLPDVAVIDSIQTLRSAELESAAGSVAQIREVSARLIDVAKQKGIALFLIGHVTKDGALAGPKVLEHLVDTVLAFEGDQSHAFRLVRSTKNRFGPTHELGVFEMVREGLREVPDPSALFLAERRSGASGSIVVPTAEGSRPLLVEVQALVAPAVYGAARRVATGVDANRLAILLAVLERKAEVHVLDRDVFVSIAGGARVDERATDLGLAVAVVSSLRERAVPADVVVFGEIGLAGEVRAVPRPGPRVAEAKKMGFARVVVPKGNAERLTAEEREGVELLPVGSLDEALAIVFE
jgi:DNA repair protein RadA/Sms